MGIMNKMRNHMQAGLLIVIGAFLITIIFSWGMGGFKGKRSQNIIGEINNKKIPADKFFNVLNEQKQQYRERKGQELSLQEQEQIKENVWESMISKTLWQNEIINRNLTANDNEIYFYLENNPPEFLRSNKIFQTDEKFDMTKYLNAFHNPQGDEWIPVENYARSIIPYIKLNNFIQSTIFINKTDALEEYSFNNTKYNINYLLVPTKLFDNDPVEISEKDISKYYAKNQNKYKVPEKRIIQYKVWDVTPSQEDTTLLMNDVENIKLRYSEGEKFADLARIFSQGPSADQGGKLGYVERGQMPPAFEKAAFNAPLNKIVGPVITRLGYHLILVTDKKRENGILKLNTSHILLKLTAGPSTIDNLLSNANIFSNDAKDFGFQKALLEHSFSADTTIGGFARSSFFFKKIGYFPYLSRWAFKNEKGTVSDPIQLENKIVVAQVLEKIPETHKSIDKVKESIITKLEQTKKENLTLKLAGKFYQEIISNNSDLKLFAKANKGVKYYTNSNFSLNNPPFQYMNNNVFAQVMESMTDGQISPPIETNNGYCIIKKTNSKLNNTGFNAIKDSRIEQLLQTKQTNETEKWQEYLKEKAKIKDYRFEYF